MKPYQNQTGKSSIKAYQLYLDAIKIRFANGSVYLFTNENCGADNIAEIKRYAQLGDGLQRFIKRRNLLQKADKIES